MINPRRKANSSFMPALDALVVERRWLGVGKTNPVVPAQHDLRHRLADDQVVPPRVLVRTGRLTRQNRHLIPGRPDPDGRQGFFDKDFEKLTTAMGPQPLRPDRDDDTNRDGKLGDVRQQIESVNRRSRDSSIWNGTADWMTGVTRSDHSHSSITNGGVAVSILVSR